MKTVHVNASKQYDILVEDGILDRVGELCERALGGRPKLAVLTDDKVDSLHGEKLMTKLADHGFDAVKFVIPNGESSKCAEKLFEFLGFMISNHITRTDAVIAFGGGVVGDLAGFAASICLRGIRFIQIPTTLLAAVDSSVGGKTAIDIPQGKNLVGTFWQPEMVICDPELLKTLDKNVLRDGYAEVIKYGVMTDEAFFDALRAPYALDMESVIERCVSIKRDIVQADEKEESGVRALLNLGHTLGHAIEKNSNFSISHGHGVAIGMVLACRIANNIGICRSDVPLEVEKIVKDYGFDISCPYSAEELYEAALSDKKRSGGTITLVLPEKIGKCVLHKIACDGLLELIRQAL